jgi:hypothetical protein
MCAKVFIAVFSSFDDNLFALPLQAVAQGAMDGYYRESAKRTHIRK